MRTRAGVTHDGIPVLTLTLSAGEIARLTEDFPVRVHVTGLELFEKVVDVDAVASKGLVVLLVDERNTP